MNNSQILQTMTNNNEYVLYIELPKQPATIHFALVLRQCKQNEWVLHLVDIQWMNEHPYNTSGGYMMGTYHESLEAALNDFQKRLQEYIDDYARYTKTLIA